MLSLIEQCPVLSNLLLQAGLDAQQHLVLLILALHLAADAGQLLLQGANHALDLVQLMAASVLCWGLVLQRGTWESLIYFLFRSKSKNWRVLRFVL